MPLDPAVFGVPYPVVNIPHVYPLAPVEAIETVRVVPDNEVVITGATSTAMLVNVEVGLLPIALRADTPTLTAAPAVADMFAGGLATTL
jgi:hypothetical protein